MAFGEAGGGVNRTKPLSRGAPLQPGTKPLTRSSRLQSAHWSRAVPPEGAGEVKGAATRRGPSSGEFSAKVKLQIRTRAGEGDPDQAVCECCGVDLGRYGGQIQHIVARGMGGTSNPVMKTAANGALLCGTAQDGDHGLAESRDPGMRRKGFWLPQGTDPRMVPMILWTGRKVWRSEDGRYLTAKPREVAA